MFGGQMQQEPEGSGLDDECADPRTDEGSCQQSPGGCMTRRSSDRTLDTKSSCTFTKQATMVFGGSDILIAILGVLTGYAATPDLIEKLAFGQAVFLIT
ncbi:hypothetical protein ASF69_01485 [Rhizobium sp. Leaf311]|nr:hypothetical protein ASF69_01485 [Rhizobium sp. Leaf311]